MVDVQAAGASLAMQYFAQCFKFGAVGLTATLVHALVFVAMIEIVAMQPLLSNLLAFGFAVSVSFAGHFHWTFRLENAACPERSKTTALMKFILTACLGLGLNSIVVYSFVDILMLPYVYALMIMTTVVPMIVFWISKHWAFA